MKCDKIRTRIVFLFRILTAGIVMFLLLSNEMDSQSIDSLIQKEYSNFLSYYNKGDYNHADKILELIIDRISSYSDYDSLAVELQYRRGTLHTSSNWSLAKMRFNDAILKYSKLNQDNHPALGVQLYSDIGKLHAYRNNKDSAQLYYDLSHNLLNEKTPPNVKIHHWQLYLTGFCQIFKDKEKFNYALAQANSIYEKEYDYDPDLKLILLGYELQANFKKGRHLRFFNIVNSYKKIVKYVNENEDNIKSKNRVAQTFLNAGLAHMSISDWKRAKFYLREALKWVKNGESNSSRILYYLIQTTIADCLNKDGDHNVAKDLTDQLMAELQSESLPSYNTLEYIHFVRSRVFNVLDLRDSAIANVDNYAKYAWKHLNSSNKSYQITWIRNAKDYHHYVASAYYFVGDFSAAYDQWVNQNPNFDISKFPEFRLRQLGQMFIKTNRIDSAMRVFNRIKGLTNKQNPQGNYMVSGNDMSFLIRLYEATQDSSVLSFFKFYVDSIYIPARHFILDSQLLVTEPSNTLYQLKSQDRIFHMNGSTKVIDDATLYELFENTRGYEITKDYLINKLESHGNDSLLAVRKDVIHQLKILGKSTSEEEEQSLLANQLNEINLKLDYVDHRVKNFLPSRQSLDLIQDYLSVDQAIFMYFSGNFFDYSLSITKEKIQLNELNKDSIGLLLQSTREALQSPYALDSTNYQALYNLILKPSFDSLPNNITSIIIIPDENTYNIPFEVFINNKNRFLINEFNISYHLSSQVWMENKKKEIMEESGKPIYLFAPKYSNIGLSGDTLESELIATLVRDGFFHLPHASKEVKDISLIWSSKIVNGEKINKTKVLKYLKKDGISHLAMHAEFNSENYHNSHLLLGNDYKNTLTFGDILTEKLKNDLVVLSACNTGFGKLSFGGDTKSLARAFLATGVPSVVMSLWRVPDESTAEIIVSFYRHMASGIPKDEALRQAKLDYLANIEDPTLANPYYWAGFVVFGDTRPLLPPKSRTMWWIIGGVIGLGLCYPLYRRFVKTA